MSKRLYILFIINNFTLFINLIIFLNIYYYNKNININSE